MKTCPNCSYVWPDEYNGQCVECGRPLGDVSGNTVGDLAFRYASQISAGQRENSSEQAMKRGRYDGVEVNDAIMAAARSLVVQREEVQYEVDDAA